MIAAFPLIVLHVAGLVPSPVALVPSPVALALCVIFPALRGLVRDRPLRRTTLKSPGTSHLPNPDSVQFPTRPPASSKVRQFVVDKRHFRVCTVQE